MAIASVNFSLDIPESVLQESLKGTDYEGVPLGSEPDHDREGIGEILDRFVADELPHLMDYMTSGEPEVEVHW